MKVSQCCRHVLEADCRGRRTTETCCSKIMELEALELKTVAVMVEITSERGSVYRREENEQSKKEEDKDGKELDNMSIFQHTLKDVLVWKLS